MATKVGMLTAAPRLVMADRGGARVCPSMRGAFWPASGRPEGGKFGNFFCLISAAARENS